MAARQPCMEMESAHEENMENTTEFYLDAFGLYIQQCLSAQDLHNLILEYKMFDPDEKERLLKYSDIKVPDEFFTEIIQSIRRMKGCPGKFTALRTALKNLGHEKAFLILSGEAFPDNDTHKKVLYNCSKEFRDMLTVEEILPNLIAEDLINDSDRQRIDRALEGKGHHSAAIELLKCLPNKKVEWYPSFMDILLGNNHKDLAKIFDEELRRLSNDGEDTCISMKIIYNRQSGIMEHKEGEQRHIQLAHFLANGCTELTRGLVEKIVELSKPAEHVDKPWSLDHFLYKNLEILSKSNIKQRNILFPGYEEKSDIEKWDLSLLCLVITKC